jgi:hypothetical protein
VPNEYQISVLIGATSLITASEIKLVMELRRAAEGIQTERGNGKVVTSPRIGLYLWDKKDGRMGWVLLKTRNKSTGCLLLTIPCVLPPPSAAAFWADVTAPASAPLFCCPHLNFYHPKSLLRAEWQTRQNVCAADNQLAKRIICSCALYLRKVFQFIT